MGGKYMIEMDEANAWWNKSPDDFKIAVWKMFFMADVIGYNPNSRTATTFNGKVGPL